jgi:hypothetical protein
MRRLLAQTTLLCAAGAAALAVLASPAAASGRQLTIMHDEALLLRSGPTVRDHTLDELKGLGTDIVKIPVYWQEVAPGPRRPAGFDGTDPNDYNWSAYDGLVNGVVARGMRPMLEIGNRAPDWAVGKRTRSHMGTYRPSAAQFRLFATAVGRRYPGVRLWSIWNEPNLASWLAPQRARGGKVPLSPSIYRTLYLAGYRGLRAAGHTHDRILIGELAPTGSGTTQKVPPLTFLRELACLDRRYRQYRGRAARRRGCHRVGRIPTSGLAYHPYTPRGGPRARPHNRDDASIGQLSRVTRTLDALARRGKLPRRLPIWITEYGFQTNPPDPFQYPIGKVPGFMDESEWLAFHNPRVASVDQYQLIDDKLLPVRGLRRYAGFQQGLRFASGRPKRAIYAAWRMPAFARYRGSRVEVFAGLRTAPAGTTVLIQSRRPHGRYRRLGGGRLSASGYFSKIFRVSSPGTRTYRITIAGRSRVKHAARR